MLENKQNSACDFAEELVSYLYDELEGIARTRFEKHLGNCSSCAEDLSEFVLARTAVQEWRDEEFSPIPTPVIEIAFAEKPLPAAHEQISRSWLTVLREFFTLSPAWMTAATAAAALVVFVGLFLVMFSSLPEGDDIVVQQTNGNKIKVSTSPTAGNDQNVSNTKENKSQTGDSPKPLTVNNPSGETTPPVKISTGTKPTNSNTKKPVPVKENVKPVKNKQTAPRLIDDEEEDDSLRLSDLLERIGSDD